jgi:Transposase, Mutator family
LPRSKTSSLDREGEAFQVFVETYEVRYQKATDCLTKDRDALLAFYDFPAEHWKYLRTTNPIESTFATIRHRTVRSKGCPSNTAALAMVSKHQSECSELAQHIIDAPHYVERSIVRMAVRESSPLRLCLRQSEIDGCEDTIDEATGASSIPALNSARNAPLRSTGLLGQTRSICGGVACSGGSDPALACRKPGRAGRHHSPPANLRRVIS